MDLEPATQKRKFVSEPMNTNSYMKQKLSILMEVFLSMDHGLLVTRNVEEVSNLALALVVTLHQKEAERNAPDLPQRVENATKRFAM